MSDTPLPVYIDARKVFGQPASIRGTIGLQKLERVAACAADASGEATVSLTFRVDDAGRRRIQGRVTARLDLPCQRCLEPVAVDIDEPVDLVLVADEEAARLLDKDFDPWISPDHRIVLADLLDEQLLLGMPLVSLHTSGSCSLGEQYAAQKEVDADEVKSTSEQSSSPFAALADLKLK